MDQNTTSDHKKHFPSIYYSCRKANGSYYYQFDCCPLNHDVTEYVNSCENPDSDDQLQNIPAFGKTKIRDALTVTVLQLPSCSKQAVYDMNTNQCRQVIYHPPLNCTSTRLNESEYYITNDGRLYLNNTQRLLNQSEFIRDSQGIISICVNNGTNNISSINGISKYSVAESYITLVGLVISIPALASTIIVYLCIPDLRTLPATFFWMNVMSFDALHTFSGLTQLRSTGKYTKRFVLYSLYAWICPLVIVTISLIFEYTPGNHGLSPEYENVICWITNEKNVYIRIKIEFKKSENLSCFIILYIIECNFVKHALFRQNAIKIV
ncbi:uncharacterized protein LOC106877191 [Octopus bimaculoides]|uniref:uncharacterized protein LOC106877191 n=1 Tax=Octopus bimaculoides TaxID=37653 RepID=UPI00071DB98B|nr:uncharacterized protein LOC106877191 [Octopus bimaculoides]|eukprot:XP_014781520.1 PREDICTED: uncharacterized protein LOC106877191 [Octopus bimaculoides]